MDKLQCYLKMYNMYMQRETFFDIRTLLYSVTIPPHSVSVECSELLRQESEGKQLLLLQTSDSDDVYST